MGLGGESRRGSGEGSGGLGPYRNGVCPLGLRGRRRRRRCRGLHLICDHGIQNVFVALLPAFQAPFLAAPAPTERYDGEAAARQGDDRPPVGPGDEFSLGLRFRLGLWFGFGFRFRFRLGLWFGFSFRRLGRRLVRGRPVGGLRRRRGRGPVRRPRGGLRRRRCRRPFP